MFDDDYCDSDFDGYDCWEPESDYQTFEDNEAWLDMRGEFDKDGCDLDEEEGWE